MADHKEIKLPQSASYSNLPEYKDHVDQILNSYDSPEGVLGELVRQMADAMWWVKTYQKDKDHLIVMKMAMLVKSRNDLGIDRRGKALRFFDCLLSSWSGQVLDLMIKRSWIARCDQRVITWHRLGRMLLGGRSRSLR